MGMTRLVRQVCSSLIHATTSPIQAYVLWRISGRQLGGSQGRGRSATRRVSWSVSSVDAAASRSSSSRLATTPGGVGKGAAISPDAVMVVPARRALGQPPDAGAAPSPYDRRYSATP